VPLRAAIYARISQDRDGLRAGVERQVEECRALASRHGWDVGGLYVDDDVSAYTGKRRPQYERMLRDLRGGLVDGVVAWHPDRLHRRPRELETFIQLAEERGFLIVPVQAGDYDLATPTGRAIARTLGAWSAHESEHKGERVKSSVRQRAAMGLPNGGVRPHGYEPDQMTIRRSEATVIRKVAKRVIAGESLSSIAQGLNESGVPTARGKQWRVTTLRSVVTGYRLCALRESNGEIVGPAAWKPILSVDQSAAIRALLLDPNRERKRTPRRYLLAGLLHCGKCGNVLVSQPTGERRRYACKKMAGLTRCGGTYIEADAIERIVIEAVLYRLDGAAFGQATESDDTDTQSAGRELLALHKRLDQFTDMLSSGDMTREAYVRATRSVRKQITDSERAQAEGFRRNDLSVLGSDPRRLRRAWPDLPLARQQSIIRAVMDYADIGPGVLGQGCVALERFHPVWRAD
jgi:site-specific DNA recombinase